MPVESCRIEGKPGYRWGKSGKCYTYTPGNEQSRNRAKDKAAKQGRAIQVNKASNIQSVRFRKDMFSKQQAISWAKSHGFKYGDVEETTNQWRLRQFPPDRCLRSGGMKHLADGVSAYICPTAATIKSILSNIDVLLDELKPSGGRDEEPREGTPGSETLI